MQHRCATDQGCDTRPPEPLILDICNEMQLAQDEGLNPRHSRFVVWSTARSSTRPEVFFPWPLGAAPAGASAPALRSRTHSWSARASASSKDLAVTGHHPV